MSELSRSILAGGNLVVDANRSLAAVRARNKRDKADAFKQVGLAAKGVGDTIKQYGDWKTAKAVEEGVRGAYEADALGRAANGADGALVGLNAMRASDPHTAKVLHDLRAKAEAEVRSKTESELDRAQDYAMERGRQERHDATLNWYRDQEGGRVAEKRAELRARETKERREAAEAREVDARARGRAAKFKKLVDTGVATAAHAWEYAMDGGALDEDAFKMAMKVVDATTVQDASKPNGAKMLAEHLGVQWFPDMDIDDVQQERDAKMRGEPKPEDDGNLTEKQRLNYNTALNSARSAKKAYDAAMEPGKGDEFGEEIPADPETVEKHRRAWILAATKANIEARRMGVNLPFDSVRSEVSDEDEAWLETQL